MRHLPLALGDDPGVRCLRPPHRPATRFAGPDRPQKLCDSPESCMIRKGVIDGGSKSGRGKHVPKTPAAKGSGAGTGTFEVSLTDRAWTAEDLAPPHRGLLDAWTLARRGGGASGSVVLDRIGSAADGARTLDDLAIISVAEAASFPIFRYVAIGPGIRRMTGVELEGRRVDDTRRTDGFGALLNGMFKLCASEALAVFTAVDMVHGATGMAFALTILACPVLEEGGRLGTADGRVMTPDMLLVTLALSGPGAGEAIRLRHLRMTAADLTVVQHQAAVDQAWPAGTKGRA